jgi:hypothetical protein
MGEFYKDLLAVATRINQGATLEQVFSKFYEEFKVHIPYDRIGVSVITEDHEFVKSIWARSEYSELHLGLGYQAKLEGSSLQRIISTGEPRILNDLETYLNDHPQSHSTRLVVKEGIRSSLTCPLIAENKPIGFLFFSKNEQNAYQDVHVKTFLEIAQQLSLVVARIQDIDRLKNLNELKNKFLGIAAHDLRSPLALVRSYVEMIQEPDFCEDSDKRKYFYSKIDKTTKRMFKLINDLLDFSAIESGNLSLEKSKISLSGFLKETINNNILTAQAKKIRIAGEIPSDLPELEIDERRINQVLDNFITNAIKFSSEDTKIIVKAEIIDDMVKISVIDQGQGIPDEEQVKLFSEFGKTSVRPTGGEKSTGLGLAIVKKIVAAHGGEVGVKSKVGKGSTFYFTLPL